MAEVKLETTIGELAPAGLASGIGTGVLLSKRTGVPFVPLFKLNVFVKFP